MTATRGSARADPGKDQLAALAQAFKATVAAHRRLRGSERRHPGELRDAQYSLLFNLARSERIASSELAHLAEVSPASATELLDELEASGLVRRERSAHDRRVVLVSLTPRGARLVQERRAQFEPRWREAFAGFSAAELQAAVAVLERMRTLFEDLAES